MRFSFKNTKARNVFFAVVVVAIIWFAVIVMIGSNQTGDPTTVLGLLLWFGWLLPLMAILIGMYRLGSYWIEVTRVTPPYRSCSVVVLFVLTSVCLCIVTLIPMGQAFQNYCNRLEPGASRSRCTYSGDDLSGKDLHGANLSRTKLDGTNLSGANLDRTNLSKANASGANLENARLTHANLSHANLRDANLKNADLSDSDLEDVDLNNANLTGARLDRANLTGVNMIGVTGLTDSMLATVSAWKGIRFDSTDTFVNTLGIVCSGENGADVLAGYDPASKFIHPVILLDADGTTNRLTDNLPGEWWPARASQVELVACISNEELVSIATCRYDNNASFERREWQATITVYEAQTHRLLGTHTVSGSSPKKCPKSIRATQANGDIVGGKITSGAVKDVLAQYVNPDGEALPLPSVIDVLSQPQPELSATAEPSDSETTPVPTGVWWKDGEVTLTPSPAPSATPSPSPSPLPSATPVTCLYTVSFGDTLASIVAETNISEEDWIAANPPLTDTSYLQIGQQLMIPGCTPSN